MIRGKFHKCPFGLSIPFACNYIGGLNASGTQAAFDMTPVGEDDSDDEAAQITEDNLDIMLLIESPSKCPFADKIFKKKKTVDCKFDEDLDFIPIGGSGIGDFPEYPSIMVGNMSKSQYGYGEPNNYMNYYTDDNNRNTNLFYGIYSLT